MRRSGRNSRLLVGLLIVHALWSAGYIWSSSGLVEGHRTFLLFDDTMVSMRYARHAAAGHGFVWNPGERVEGFSNPLWTVGLSVLHRLPLPPGWMSLPVQFTGWLLMSGTIVLSWRLTAMLAPRSPAAPFVAALLTGGSLALNRWALLGTESAALALIATLMATRSITPGSSSLGVLAVVATLIRMDGALIGFAFVMSSWFESRAGRRRAAVILACVLGALVLQTGVRFLYYGEWLPNTYRLKMTGYPVPDRVLAGGRLFLSLLLSGGLWLAIPAFVAVPWRESALVRRLVALCVLHAAYSIWVGGDAWDGWGGCNRFVAPAIPALSMLIAAGWSRWPTGLGRLRFVAPAVWLIGFNAFNGLASIDEWTLRAPAFGSADNLSQARLARRLDALTHPDARIAVVRAGTLPYFLDRPGIDLLGKCDARIARLPAHREFGFYPGHIKWDYAWSIGVRDPDVIIQLWHRPAEADQWIRRYVTIVLEDGLILVARGSPRVDWTVLQRAPMRLSDSTRQ